MRASVPESSGQFTFPLLESSFIHVLFHRGTPSSFASAVARCKHGSLFIENRPSCYPANMPFPKEFPGFSGKRLLFPVHTFYVDSMPCFKNSPRGTCVFPETIAGCSAQWDTFWPSIAKFVLCMFRSLLIAKPPFFFLSFLQARNVNTGELAAIKVIKLEPGEHFPSIHSLFLFNLLVRRKRRLSPRQSMWRRRVLSRGGLCRCPAGDSDDEGL